MRNDLVAEEIEVHPFVARASFGTREQVSIEGTRFAQIANRKGQMETRARGHERSRIRHVAIVGKRMLKPLATRSARRELLRIEGRPVEVTMRLNPRARRLIVKVHPSTGEVSVVAPSQRALDRALDFARGEAAWIARRLAEVPKVVTLAPGSRVPYRGREHAIRDGRVGPSPVWIEEGDI